MQKFEHDSYVATVREISYDKSWFTAAETALQNVALQRGIVLDFCCGNGEFSEILKKKFNHEVVCLDYSPSHLDRVRNIGFETIECNVEDGKQCHIIASQNINKFDAVVMLECIEHFFSPDEVLAFVNKMLKPSGYLIITTPNITNLSYRIYSMFCGNLPVAMGHHTYFFNARRLSQLLLLNAFDIDSIHFFGKTGYYLDRALAYPKSFAKQLLLKLLWQLGKSFGREEINSCELIAVAQKNPKVKPLALDPAVRKKFYVEMERDEQMETLRRLSLFLQQGLFAEHPGLCKFLEQEIIF
jgi:2-polyprenyl-6-hydroxyphenyl methylase/3-demethylubiquinone-9 3-methyltransferase